MTHSDDQNRFLRSALKAGLRLQQRAGGDGAGPESSPRSEGVAVLQRVKGSLQKSNRRRHTP